MKRYRNQLTFLISILLLVPLYGAEQKPSAWQKFKNVFSSKKTEQNQPMELDAEKVGLLKSISNVYKQGSKFSKFSKEQTKMVEVKIKTLEFVQERINKISKEPGFIAKLFWTQKSPSPIVEEEKVRLAEQIGRLRADLFMTFVEIFQEMKPVLASIRDMMKRGVFKNVELFDTMIQNCDSLVLQGNDITERLLRASNAYSKTILIVGKGRTYPIEDINKESELLINDYFKSAVKVMSMIAPATTAIKGVVSSLKNMAWVVNSLSLGSISSLTATLILIDKVLGVGKIAADLSKDIFIQVVEKNNLKSIQSKIVSSEKEIEKTGKVIEHEDELVFADLMSKK